MQSLLDERLQSVRFWLPPVAGLAMFSCDFMVSRFTGTHPFQCSELQTSHCLLSHEPVETGGVLTVVHHVIPPARC
ncbi:hypothetical protein DBR06_SOUSAS7110029 [Sousa chinensis]|nr:hypothetical protein DBR06_SOUSAS7110029 [Sousa chinensis]